LTHAFLPGPRVRPGLDRAAAGELMGFGKWVFLSTLCGFLMTQGDKAILGRALTLDQLGIYNIGYFLASFPLLLGQSLVGRVLIPIYRETRLAADPAAAQRRLRRMRAGMTTLLLLPLLLLAFLATPLIGLLYDARYADAAGVMAALAAAHVMIIIGLTYDQAALAAGNSRGFFAVIATRSLVQTAAFLAGLWAGGLPGALLAYGLSAIALHVPIVLLARHHGVWDVRHDALAAGIALPLAVAALWQNRAALAALEQFGG
ncbi:MAG: oligosaccharide flippase family protein, partial [Gemmobacter sp.]